MNRATAGPRIPGGGGISRQESDAKTGSQKSGAGSRNEARFIRAPERLGCAWTFDVVLYQHGRQLSGLA